MLIILFSHIVLDGTGVMAIVGQLITTGMAQHVWVHAKPDTSDVASPGDDLAHSSRCDRPPVLSHEDVRGVSG